LYPDPRRQPIFPKDFEAFIPPFDDGRIIEEDEKSHIDSMQVARITLFKIAIDLLDHPGLEIIKGQGKGREDFLQIKMGQCSYSKSTPFNNFDHRVCNQPKEWFGRTSG
jgi:hypothetical protein